MKTNTPKQTVEFPPMTFDDIDNVLSLTIKEDRENKIATLLCMVSAYTEDSQFNLSFNAPSSTGKSYIPLEVAKLFPKEDVMQIANCSPTAFFHDNGTIDKETGEITVDLSRRIIIFTDQPGNQLLEKMRSLLSHDQKEMRSKITDRITQGGNRTKNVTIKGYPSVIFCSAGLELDEQEATRFLLLSPEMSQEKISRGINEKILKEANSSMYRSELENNSDRLMIEERILAIKNEHIEDIRIDNSKIIKTGFLKNRKILKPRDQRDISRLISLVKANALLNLWHRKRENNIIYANFEDIRSGLGLWEIISESQELNLPPYVYDLYKNILLPLWQEINPHKSPEDDPINKSMGITRQQIQQRHYSEHNRMIDCWQFRQILPMLEASGLIAQEPSSFDRRRQLIYPLRSVGVRQSSKLIQDLDKSDGIYSAGSSAQECEDLKMTHLDSFN